MPHNSRNFIVAYTLLVALPIVGLIVVIKSGRKLVAPISVDGTWNLRVDPERLASIPCGKTLAEAADAALVISQSGKNFTLSLANGPKSSGAGVLNGVDLQASLAPSAEWSAEAGCADRELAWVARVDPKADPRSLEGSISVNNCPSCGSVDFRATRRTPPTGRRSH